MICYGDYIFPRYLEHTTTHYIGYIIAASLYGRITFADVRINRAWKYFRSQKPPFNGIKLTAFKSTISTMVRLRLVVSCLMKSGKPAVALVPNASYVF